MADPHAGRPAILLDRDGTLIVDTGYLSNAADVRLLPGAAEALRRLRAMGYALVVVSNQSGVGRGLTSAPEAAAVDQRFRELFSAAGIEFDAVYYCPHPPDAGCDCRKPEPGLLLAAQQELGLDLGASFMAGDRLADVAAGRNAGARGVLVTPVPALVRQARELHYLVCGSIAELPQVVAAVTKPGAGTTRR